MAYTLALVLIALFIFLGLSLFFNIVSPTLITILFFISIILIVIIFGVLIVEKVKNKEDRYYDDNIHQ